MTLLIAVATLLILALIVAISATRKQSERNNRVDSAKLRAEMRSNAKDVWEASVPKKVIQSETPIDYNLSVNDISVEDDVSDSQYQLLKTIFEGNPVSTRTIEVKNDYWAHTEPMGLIK